MVPYRYWTHDNRHDWMSGKPRDQAVDTLYGMPFNGIFIRVGLCLAFFQITYIYWLQNFQIMYQHNWLCVNLSKFCQISTAKYQACPISGFYIICCPISFHGWFYKHAQAENILPALGEPVVKRERITNNAKSLNGIGLLSKST